MSAMVMRVAACICAIAGGSAFIVEHPIEGFILGLGAVIFSVWSAPGDSSHLTSEQGKRS